MPVHGHCQNESRFSRPMVGGYMQGAYLDSETSEALVWWIMWLEVAVLRFRFLYNELTVGPSARRPKNRREWWSIVNGIYGIL